MSSGISGNWREALKEAGMALLIIVAYYSIASFGASLLLRILPESKTVTQNAVGTLAGFFMLLLLPDRRSVQFKRSKKDSFYVPVTIMSAGLLSVLFQYAAKWLNAADYSPMFQKTVVIQEQAGIIEGLLFFCILAPLAEELLFRACLYGRLKKILPVPFAILISALVFGLVHGNPVQGIYAFFMGTMMAYLYEKTGNFSYPVLFHFIANLLTLLL